MRDFIIDDPNFSIIMPGGCNASCYFCFYKYQPKTEMKKEQWFEKLQKTINKLPIKFQQVSITGGEPTLNIENLTRTVNILRSRFKKIVLSTNGFNLSKLDKIVNNHLVDYINISRHFPSWIDNVDIFKTNKGVKTTHELRLFIEKTHKYGIPVTINCVVTPKLKINSMIDYCHDIGAYAVKFREISSPNPIYNLSAEKELSCYDIIYQESTGYI